MLRKCIIWCALSATTLLAATPSNPNATQGAKDLLNYLVAISGKKILSGQESMWNDGSLFPSTRDQYVYSRTNKYPAVYASDFGDFGTGNLSDRSKIVNNVTAYAKKGSIISIQYHMIQPDLPDGSGFSAMNIKGSTYTKMNEILTEGSSFNKIFKQRLDELAGYLNTMHENGVTVMFRPYHEMNGDWFWWSYQERYKDLWIYTWKYMTETKKCNNLLWVFSANYWSGSADKANPRFYYPGHNYVDILGMDVYTNYGHSYSKSCHDSLRVIGNGKPIAITENGTLPANFAAWRAEQPYWVYWLTWWGFEGDGKGNTQAVYDEVYKDPSVITLDEINSVDLTEKMVAVSVEGSGTVTKSPEALTVSKGTSVTLTATAAEGWEFGGWSGSVTSSANPLKFTADTDYDLKAIFKPLPGTKVNLVKNGDFSQSATTGWNQISVMEGGAATGAVVNGELAVTINSGGSLAWSVQLTQNDVRLESNKSYRLSFKARADSPKEIFVKIGQNGGSYTAYGTENFSITTSVKEYSVPFTMKTTDPSARIEFNIGLNTIKMYLDDVTLFEESKTPAALPGTPGLKSDNLHLALHPEGLRFNFPEGSSGVQQFTLYRIDGKKVLSVYNTSGLIERKKLTMGVYTIRASNGIFTWNRIVPIY